MSEELTSKDLRRNAQWVDFICPDNVKMRLVNSHRPSSKLNPYSLTIRHDVCTSIFQRAANPSLFPPDAAAEHESQTTTPIRVVVAGDLNVDKHQIASYGKECDLDVKLIMCAASRRKAQNGEKTVKEAKSKDDDEK